MSPIKQPEVERRRTPHASRRFVVGLSVVMLVAFTITFWLLSHQLNALENEEIDRQLATCESQREFRREFPATLRIIARPPETGVVAVDLTAVPGFEGLDPTTQEYLRALTLVLNSTNNNSERLLDIADAYQKAYPIPDCEALKEDLGRD